MQSAKTSPHKIPDGTLEAVIKGFMASPRWLQPDGYAKATKANWRCQLELLGKHCGHLSIYIVRPSIIQGFMDGLAGRPGKQAVALAAIRQMEAWAIVRDLLPHPISTGVEIEKSSGGHLPWSDAHVALAEVKARPDLAMAVTLAANTGQRGSDLIRMCWSDIELIDGRPGINVRQKKTGKVLWVPFTAALQTAMAKWERRPGRILTQLSGNPWTRAFLTNSWAIERDTNQALAPLRADALPITARMDGGLVLHGLRGTACVRLRRLGAETMQIADMVGMSAQMVERYCRFSDQRKNAVAAVIHLDRTPVEQRKKDSA